MSFISKAFPSVTKVTNSEGKNQAFDFEQARMQREPLLKTHMKKSIKNPSGS